MIKALYDWSLKKVASPKGEWWLGLLSFAESFFFPLPVDILLVPMVFARPHKAWRLAFIATITGILGAFFGYMLGAFFYESLAAPLIELYGYSHHYDDLQKLYNEHGVLIILLGGLTPIPFKLVAIASGVFGMNPLWFILLCFPARAPRFFLEAWLLRRFGAPLQPFVERHLGPLLGLAFLLMIGGYWAVRWL